MFLLAAVAPTPGKSAGVVTSALPTPGPTGTPCPPTEGYAAIINAANTHWYGLPAIIVAVVVGIILYAIFKGIGGENIAKIFTNKADKTVTDERDDANGREAAAKELSETLLGQLELLRLVLTTAAVSIQRFNNRTSADGAEYGRAASDYICDWTTRIFAFTKSDICKVTIWASTGRGTLKVRFFNGMSPESAAILDFMIHPATADEDTFTAMAFRSGRPEVCHDVGTDPRYKKLGKAPAHAYASIIAVPIIRAGATVGVLTIDSLFKDNFRGADSEQLAEICASLCALFWEDSPAAGIRSVATGLPPGQGQPPEENQTR